MIKIIHQIVVKKEHRLNKLGMKSIKKDLILAKLDLLNSEFLRFCSIKISIIIF